MKKFIQISCILFSVFLLGGCSKNADKDDSSESEYTLAEALQFINEGNKDKGYAILEKEAEKGSLEAQSALGMLLVAQRKYKEGFKWTYEAAQHGNAGEKFNLAELYSHGYGTKENPKEAFKWYKEAADMGYAGIAMEKVGDCYLTGYGTKQNFEEGYKYYEKAAKLGHIPALMKAAQCYLNGMGVEKNEIKGMGLIYGAAQLGDSTAIEIINKFKEDMGPEADEILSNYPKFNPE